MTTLAIEIEIPSVENATATEDTLRADLSDGRRISVPITWHPSQAHANTQELNNI